MPLPLSGSIRNVFAWLYNQYPGRLEVRKRGERVREGEWERGRERERERERLKDIHYTDRCLI